MVFTGTLGRLLEELRMVFMQSLGDCFSQFCGSRSGSTDPHVLGLLDPDPDPLVRGSMDPEPDPHQNVMDSQEWFSVVGLFFIVMP